MTTPPPAATGHTDNPPRQGARSRRRLRLWFFHLLYRQLSWLYDAVSWTASLGQWDRWRRLALSYVESGPVLEVGFGTGGLLADTARAGWQVTGLDLSPQMQARAASLLDRTGLDVPRLRADVHALPFASGAFPTLISTFPAEFILEPEVWGELARVLRPGRPGGGAWDRNQARPSPVARPVPSVPRRQTHSRVGT